MLKTVYSLIYYGEHRTQENDIYKYYIYCNVEYVCFLESNVTKLSNEVHAKIMGIPVPFWGVHGSNACEKLFLEDAETKTTCPLSAGNEYIYKDTFRISEYYPKVSHFVTIFCSLLHLILMRCSFSKW